MAENHIVYSFILQTLKLKGAMANVFAVIFGFWLAGYETFQSNSSLASRLGVARETVNRVIDKLLKKDLITLLPQHTRYGCRCYTINLTTLDEMAPDWRHDIPKKALARCDASSHLPVMENHTSCDQRSHLPVDKSHSSCDKRSHQDKNENEKERRIEENCPLPNNLAEDEEFRHLWQCLLRSSRWSSRTPDMLEEAARALDGQPVAVAREMLRHTISGDYPRIYPPSDEVLSNARKASCDASSHLAASRAPEKTDDAIIGKVIALIPQELREFAYGTGMGPRALRLDDNEGDVTIYLPTELRDWFDDHKDALEAIAQGWAGASFKVLTPFILTS